MTPSTDHPAHDLSGAPDAPGDDVLLEAARNGDQEALAALRERYSGTALAVARARTDDAEAEDVASAALDRIEQIVSEGYGPHAFLGAFVVWMVGREADGGTGPVALPEDRTDPASLVRAFTRLPAEWQVFLWHTQIQGRSVRRAAAALAISPIAAASLQRDIFTGLRRAYRHAGAGLEAGAECARSRGDILGMVQGTLPLERRRRVQQHLDGCTSCAAEYLRLQDPGTGLRTWLLPVLAGLPLWGAEAAELAGLIRGADAAAEEDGSVAASPWAGRGMRSLLGAGALVAAASAAVVGLAFTEEPAQNPEAFSAGEIAPVEGDPGPGAAGTGDSGETGAVPAEEERSEATDTGRDRDRSEATDTGPDRDRSAAAPAQDEGWGPAESAEEVLPALPEVEGEVGGTGAVPASGGRGLSAAALPGGTGSGTQRSAALPAASGGAPAEAQATARLDDGASHDAVRAEAERSSARTPASEPSPGMPSPSPSSVLRVHDPATRVLMGPAPETSPAPSRWSFPPSEPERDRDVRDGDERRTNGKKYTPETQGDRHRESHGGWSWNEERGGGHHGGHHDGHRGGHHDGHRDGTCDHRGESWWGCGTR